MQWSSEPVSAMRESGNFIEIAGVNTCVYDSGPAPGHPTLVMVHGGDTRSLSNALDWSTIWSADDLGTRLIAYDKPGQGRSYTPGLPAAAATLSGLSSHLRELIHGLEGPVVLMGHSRGALPVAEVALDPEIEIAGLVLVASNTLAPRMSSTPVDFYPRAYANPPIELDDEYLRREPTMNSISAAHVDEDFLAGRRDPALQSGWWRDLEHRTAIYPEIADSLAVGRQRVLEGISEIGFQVPVLQIWGAADISAPVELGHALFASICQHSVEATAVTISGAAHYVYRESPVRFAAALASFLTITFP